MCKHQTIQYDKNLPARIRLRDGPIDNALNEPHWHEELQLIYVDSGTLVVSMGESKQVLTAGAVTVISPRTEHALSGVDARYLTVHFSHVFVKSFFDSVEKYDFKLEEGSQERREISWLMQKLLAIEQNPFDEYSALVKYSLTLKMLRILLTRCCAEKQEAVVSGRCSHDSRAQMVKDYIEANFRRKLFISEIAELLGCTTLSATLIFKNLVGKSFTEYTTEVRVRHALDDYLTHDVPVCEAALKNGFGHYNHFTNACRKYYGASPTALKKAKRQRDVASNAPMERSA